MSSIAFSFTVHARPTCVRHNAQNSGCVIIGFSEYKFCYPDVTIYTGDAALAVELTEAISAVLAKHEAKMPETEAA